MKFNKRLIYKFISATLLILLVGVFTQCIATNTEQVGYSSSSNNNSNNHTAPTDPGQIINNTEVSEGIKSHEQIFYTMSALTGVPVTNNEVRNVYNQVSTSLPTDNDLKVFLPPHQLAITKLAAEFCNSLVENTTLRQNIWPNYNAFTATVGRGSLSQQNREIIIQGTVDAFWGGVISEDELYAAEEDLDNLITELLVNESTTDAAVTRNVIKGVCTVALSSAHVTLF